jgi:hypothetical protein
MKKSLFVVIILIYISTYSYAQYWMKIDGVNPYINKIFSPIDEPNRILVASSGFPTDILQKNIEFPFVGNGYQESVDSGKTFTKYQLNERSVYDIYQSKINPDNWFVAARHFTRGGVLLSTNRGNDWSDDMLCESSNQIYRISSKIIDGKEFFAAAAINTSEGFVYSDNDFITCNSSSYSVETRSVAFSKISNLLFLSGDASSQGRVMRSYNNGQTWLRESSGLEGLRVLSILPSSINPSIVLCGVDSLTVDGSSIGKGIYISLDTGNTWQYFTGAGNQIFEFAEHPCFPHLVAAAAGNAGVLVSSIYGHYFEAFNNGLPADKSVRTVMIPNWDTTEAGFVIFAGVYGEGLFKSTYLKTSVESNEQPNLKIASISPQPASDFLNFRINLPFAQNCNITILNTYGQEIYKLQNVYLNAGENSFNWNADGFPSGVYFIHIQSDKYLISDKFVISR